MSRESPASAAWARYYANHSTAVAVWGESNGREPNCKCCRPGDEPAERDETEMETPAGEPTPIRLPSRCLGRLDHAIQSMNDEDSKPIRSRDGRVYAAGYAIVETFGLMLRLPDPSSPDVVRAAVAAVIDRSLDDY